MVLPDLTDLFIADTYRGMLHTSNVPVVNNLPPVYDGLGNKTSLSIGSDGNGASISGTLSADGFTIRGFASLIDYIYPINSIYLSIDNINPGVRFLGTSWTQEALGRFLAGVGTGNDGVYTKTINSGDNNGEYEHKLTIAEIPSHSHSGITATIGAQGDFITNGEATLLDSRGSMDHENSGHTQRNGVGKLLRLDGQVFLDNTGGSLAHNNTPPSYGVYVWRRIS
jgi:microcystin-dependent protein